jgi:predicted CXXCH cytochrome family protein
MRITMNRKWNAIRARGLPRRVILGTAITGTSVLLVLMVISCGTVQRTAVLLPNVPGATYVGSKDCEQCHEELYRGFKNADHARLIAQGPNAINAGCESCHGPCSVHSSSGGDVKPPYSFTSGRPQARPMTDRLAAAPPRTTDMVCYECHTDVRGQFNLPNHHPLPEGRISCIQCHSPHKGSAHIGGGTALLSQNDTCIECHAAQRGPYTFEHEALREGCTTCHAPHGSVNAKMLTERNSNLCFKCHFQRVQNGDIYIGGQNHSTSIQRGTCWSAGCHEAVHGSRVNSSLRF